MLGGFRGKFFIPLSYTVFYNQKYKILNGETTTATGQYGIGGVLWGTYVWKDIGVYQWCTNSFIRPDLTLYTKRTKILYGRTGDVSPPQSMPGYYVNGDVPAYEGDINGVHFVVPFINWQGYVILKTYGVEWIGQPGNYTWNDDGNLRGPGGSPVLPCDGVPY
jgi:hypothetical protein